MANIYRQRDPDSVFQRHTDRDDLIGDNDQNYMTKRLEEIEKCLKQDKKMLSSITDALEQNDKLAMRMESIFLSLTGRLDGIKNKFITIYEESERLKQLNLTLAHLDPVITHYQVIETTKSIISQGPTGHLKEYLDCLDRIKRATDYFEEVIPEGPELKALRVSQNLAKGQLQFEFKRLLLKCSNPASPIAILNLIDPEEVLGTQKENVGIPGPMLQDMAAISIWFLEDYPSLDYLLEDSEEDFLSVYKRQSVKKLKTQSLARDTCGGSPKKQRIASWLSNKLKTCSLDRSPTLGPLPYSREESQPHELSDITEEEFPLTMVSRQSRLKTGSLDRLESSNTFKSPFPGSPFTRKTVSWKKGKMKILLLERHPDFVPVHAQSVSNLLEDIEEDSLSASKWQSVKKLKTQSLDREACGGSPKKSRIASWLSTKLKTCSLDRPPTLGPLPYNPEESQVNELPDITEEEFPLTIVSSPSRLKTQSLDCLESPNTFKAPFPGSPFTRKTVLWTKGKMKTRSLERHPDFVPVQRVNIFALYAEARSCYMHQSLKDFRDHLRMRSAFSTSLNSLSSASSSCSLSSSSPSSLSSFKGTLKRFFKRLGKEDWCDIDIHCYSQCLKAFSLLAGVEFSALAEVFPEFYWKRTFDPLVQQALNFLTEEGEYIIFAARHAVNGHRDFGALLMILRAHDTLKVTQPSIDKVLEHTTNKTQNKLPHLIKSMEVFAYQAMEKYSTTILDEWYKKREMPEDGTVHELTSNVVLFLSQLVQLRSTTELFASTNDNDIRHNETADDDITCLRPFISEALEKLFMSLDNMASTYKDPYLRAIYLFNNYNYIHKSMLRAPLRCVVWEGGAGAGEAQAVWERRTEEQKQKYLQSWLTVTEHLKDDGIAPVQPGSKFPFQLKDKERHLIKGKFQKFNTSLEGLIRGQRKWTISDPEQREALSKGQAYRVGQAYRAFLQRYKQIKFTTKHLQKCYKYTTREVEEMITSFFDSLI